MSIILFNTLNKDFYTLMIGRTNYISISIYIYIYIRHGIIKTWSDGEAGWTRGSMDLERNTESFQSDIPFGKWDSTSTLKEW